MDLQESPRLVFGFAGEHMQAIKAEQIEWIRDLLRRRDPVEIHEWGPSLVPYFCPFCRRTYCGEHFNDRAHLQHAAQLPER